MFLKTSRYYKQDVVETEITSNDTQTGQTGGTGKKTVKAVKLRRLPEVTGNPAAVKDNYRLDIIAQRQYENPTKFWHIADAGTKLQANDLLEEESIIKIPEK